MKKPLLNGICILFFISFLPFANAESQNVSSDGKEKEFPSKNERWYTYWGLGLGAISYESEGAEDRNELPSLSESGHRNTQFELLGFYWPLDNYKTILGVVLTSVFDEIQTAQGRGDATTSLLGFSGMHFFGKNAGDGIFFRGDFGPAWTNFNGVYQNDGDIVRTRMGSGLLLAGGYGLPIFGGTRLLFTTGVRVTNSKKFHTGQFFLTGGFLF